MSRANVASVVMVRSTGPDPTGQKCIGRPFFLTRNGVTAVSASGVVVDAQSGLILTAASTVSLFLKEISAGHIDDLAHGAHIDILFRSEAGEPEKDENENEVWRPAELLGIVEAPGLLDSLHRITRDSPSIWEVGWGVGSEAPLPRSQLGDLQDALLSKAAQFPTAKSAGTPAAPGAAASKRFIASDSSALRMTPQNVNISGIALLRCTSVPPNCAQVDLNRRQKLERGRPVILVASPYGILSPAVFHNSVSSGIVSNYLSSTTSIQGADCEHPSLVVTDARTLPGSEGGGCFDPETGAFQGMIVPPIRRKDKEPVDVSFVLSADAIHIALAAWSAAAADAAGVPATSPTDPARRDVVPAMLPSPPSSTSILQRSMCFSAFPNAADLFAEEDDFDHDMPLFSPISAHTRRAVVLVAIQNTWASGIIISDKGHILTNAHVLHPYLVERGRAPDADSGDPSKSAAKWRPEKPRLLSSTRILIRAEYPERQWHETTKVLYVSSSTLDLAILRCDSLAGLPCMQPALRGGVPSTGEKVFVLGHGLFGPRCDVEPLVTSGVLSSVVTRPSGSIGLSKKSSPGAGERDALARLAAAAKKTARPRVPILFQSSATVHRGNSGGPLIDMNGAWIGIVTSNARHSSGRTITNLNFSVPVFAFIDSVEKFVASEDLEALRPLEECDSYTSDAWELRTRSFNQPTLPKSKLLDSLQKWNKVSAKFSAKL